MKREALPPVSHHCRRKLHVDLSRNRRRAIPTGATSGRDDLWITQQAKRIRTIRWLEMTEKR